MIQKLKEICKTEQEITELIKQAALDNKELFIYLNGVVIEEGKMIEGARFLEGLPTQYPQFLLKAKEEWEILLDAQQLFISTYLKFNPHKNRVFCLDNMRTEQCSGERKTIYDYVKLPNYAFKTLLQSSQAEIDYLEFDLEHYKKIININEGIANGEHFYNLEPLKITIQDLYILHQGEIITQNSNISEQPHNTPSATASALGKKGAAKANSRHIKAKEKAREIAPDIIATNPKLQSNDIIWKVGVGLKNNNIYFDQKKEKPYSVTKVRNWIKDLIPEEQRKIGRPKER